MNEFSGGIWKKVKYFLKNHRSQITTTATSIASVVLAILANNLYDAIQSILKEDVSHRIICLIGIALIIVTVALFFILACVGEWVQKKFFPEFWDDFYMKEAFLHIRKLGSDRQKSFQELLKHSEPSNEFIVCELVSCMQLTVDSCYNFFNSIFSKSGELVNELKFEVTFMTKSYKDSEITIPCSANEESRTPISMLLRENDPTIFNKTETAKIYMMSRPSMSLVEDTSKTNYAETYESQRERIRSTVILPVLSHSNELLGTLVVHCNKAGFFKESRKQFWNELLELFSVELGYHKLMLDYYIKNNSNLPKPF